MMPKVKDRVLTRVRGALADRYDVKRRIGSGGVAYVFYAVDRATGDAVAVKVLSSGLSSRLMRERFLREAEVAGRLEHPNILPIDIVGQLGDTLYLVMPYVSGGSLRSKLDDGGPLPPDRVVRIGREIATALEAAHARGYLHRDIKPDNVLFDGDRAVLADFGVAVAIKAGLDERLTLPGQVLGTPTYMSPEQAMGRYQLDARSDLYSLGCLLFECVSGAPPFRARHPEAVLVRRLGEEVPPFDPSCGVVPPSLRAVLCRALEWKPEKRFASAAEMRAALERIAL